MRELAEVHLLDRRTVKKLLAQYKPRGKVHHPRPVHLVVDATYFGVRTEETSWCMVVARDPHTQENLWWDFVDTETTDVYRRMRTDVEALGYTIQSVTGDGFGGIRQAFCGIPYQMCLVHMERLVVKGTTRNPQLEAGRILLALVKTLFDTNSNMFRRRLRAYYTKYHAVLNEKTVNPFTGESDWKHAPLHYAFTSLLRFEQ